MSPIALMAAGHASALRRGRAEAGAEGCRPNMDPSRENKPLALRAAELGNAGSAHGYDGDEEHRIGLDFEAEIEQRMDTRGHLDSVCGDLRGPVRPCTPDARGEPRSTVLEEVDGVRARDEPMLDPEP